MARPQSCYMRRVTPSPALTFLSTTATGESPYMIGCVLKGRRHASVPADETAGAGLASTAKTALPLNIACTGLTLAPDTEKMRKNVQAQHNFIRKHFTGK